MPVRVCVCVLKEPFKNLLRNLTEVTDKSMKKINCLLNIKIRQFTKIKNKNN